MRSTLQPNLYECEKCGEHFCDHAEPAEQQEVQPMLVLRTPDILRTKMNGIQFETPNFTLASNTPMANSPMTRSPIILRPLRNLPTTSRSAFGTSVTNSPVIGRSISQNTLRIDRDPPNQTDESVPSGNNSETNK